MSRSGERRGAGFHAEETTLRDSSGPILADLIPKMTLGRYLVIEPLGSGAMGMVMRAYDPRLHREVALKLLHHHGSIEAQTRMLREAQSMAQLSHPNVVGVYDAETTEQGLMIAMELVVGEPLARWLREEPRSQAQILAVFVQAGRGLAAAHAAGIVHRDFKPANVFVGDEGDVDPHGAGRVRVGDFGLAREISSVTSLAQVDLGVESSAIDLTATGTVVGTPAYMAPEQHYGQVADERSDQFAFCVSLWEALHGERPFKAKTVPELAAAKRRGQLGPPRAKLPAALQAVLRRGLSPDPADRWPSLSSLIEQLEPRRARWGVWLTGMLAAVVGTGAAVMAIDTTDPRQVRCRGAMGQLSGAWSAETHRELSTSAKVPPRLTEALDAYAVELRHHYEQACEPNAGLDDLNFDVTLACLDRRVRRVASVVDVVATSPADRLEREVSILTNRLTSIERCAQRSWMGMRELLPDDPDERERVLEIGDEIHQALILDRQGRLEEAWPVADAALARAEASGFIPVVADALFGRALLAKSDGQLDHAATLIKRAFELRLSVGDDVGAFDAAGQLIFVRGVRQMHYGEADSWMSVARGLMGRVDLGPIDRGWFYNSVGASMVARGRPEAALEFLGRALDELTVAYGPDHPAVADPLTHLTTALLQLGRAEEALEPARRALELRESHGVAYEDQLICWINLARAQAGTGSISEATDSMARAMELADREEASAQHRSKLWRQLSMIHDEAGQVVAAAEARAVAEALDLAPLP